jgi:hypothetical protein
MAISFRKWSTQAGSVGLISTVSIVSRKIVDFGFWKFVLDFPL